MAPTAAQIITTRARITFRAFIKILPSLSSLNQEYHSIDQKNELIKRWGNTLLGEAFAPKLCGDKGGYIWTFASKLLESSHLLTRVEKVFVRLAVRMTHENRIIQIHKVWITKFVRRTFATGLGCRTIHHQNEQGGPSNDGETGESPRKSSYDGSLHDLCSRIQHIHLRSKSSIPICRERKSSFRRRSCLIKIRSYIGGLGRLKIAWTAPRNTSPKK
jgi:hypothetical protein